MMVHADEGKYFPHRHVLIYRQQTSWLPSWIVHTFSSASNVQLTICHARQSSHYSLDADKARIVFAINITPDQQKGTQLLASTHGVVCLKSA